MTEFIEKNLRDMIMEDIGVAYEARNQHYLKAVRDDLNEREDLTTMERREIHHQINNYLQVLMFDSREK